MNLKSQKTAGTSPKTTGAPVAAHGEAAINENPLLTKPEAARLIRKTTRTLEVWVKKKWVSHLKIGRTVLFRRDQLLADLEKFSVGGMGDV